MVLNRQLECGFRKESPSLINTFFLSPRWAANWNACNCHWLEKMFIWFFLNGKTWKLHFTSISELWMPPPTWDEAIRQSAVRMPPRAYFFSRQKRIYILDPPSHHKKGSLPHNVHSFSNFSGYLEVLGIWMYLFENIYIYIHILGCADNCTPQPTRSLSVPWFFWKHTYLVCI